ncbi:hypothetical protein Dda3937_00302 [Dickeya dadantii 3937]|uniref:Uncharacterized protein n=1 Tax=Dickeya dadantii (strain 3937) TaxID=198628 RepID=E0SKM3_DICD3|nr:hypothetical protein Dda3937_00302 [Dickeya dadantii 3937]
MLIAFEVVSDIVCRIESAPSHGLKPDGDFSTLFLCFNRVLSLFVTFWEHGLC